MRSVGFLALDIDVYSHDQEHQQWKDNPGGCESHLFGFRDCPKVFEKFVRGSLLFSPFQLGSFDALSFSYQIHLVAFAISIFPKIYIKDIVFELLFLKTFILN